MHAESIIRPPLIHGNKTYEQITEDISRAVEMKPTRMWWIVTTITTLVMLWGFFAISWTVWFGIGTWGLNRTVGWGWDITNFVWWIGIGHAGTLISAILLLFRQKWRVGVNRAAEAMTIFAVICAGLFPVFHMGRVWIAFFNLPYPNTRGPVWPNFNSPLMWDVFAISTYFSVSLMFWYTGLIPDIATIRDRAKTKISKIFYGIFSFGWVGSAKHWQRHEALSLVSQVFQHLLYSLFTRSYPLTSPPRLFPAGIQPSSHPTSLRELSSPDLRWC
jgi:molybdopterin-containing oxidoreductase family membrane subunit